MRCFAGEIGVFANAQLGPALAGIARCMKRPQINHLRGAQARLAPPPISH